MHPMYLLIYHHKIISRMWVTVHLLSLICIADMPLWNPIQPVSCCAHPELNLRCWYATMKSHPESELLYTFWAQFALLICHYEISSRQWVFVHLLSSICITDMPLWNPIQFVSCCAPSELNLCCWYATMKFYPGSELLCTFWAQFALLICHYEISSRKWVAVQLLSPICIPDMPLWNPIQEVSCCAPPELNLHCWHAIMKSHPGSELVCTSWA